MIEKFNLQRDMATEGFFPIECNECLRQRQPFGSVILSNNTQHSIFLIVDTFAALRCGVGFILKLRVRKLGASELDVEMDWRNET